jgi:YD repeat-containing protein
MTRAILLLSFLFSSGLAALAPAPAGAEGQTFSPEEWCMRLPGELLSPGPNGPSPFGETCAKDLVPPPPDVFHVPNNRNVEEVIDSRERHLRDARFEAVTDADGRVTAVKDSSGRDVRRFGYDDAGQLVEVILPNGGYVSVTAGESQEWSFRDRQGYISPTRMQRLAIDQRGNISFANPSIAAQVTLTADEKTIIEYWHRSEWALLHRDARIELTAGGLVGKVVGPNGQQLREFIYDSDGLVRIANFDTTSWHTMDGGKTWIFTEASGTEAPYAGLDIKVDQLGNVGYSIGVRAIVEFTDGVNMVDPPPEWTGRWID